jgi:hypothetical protein
MWASALCRSQRGWSCKLLAGESSANFALPNYGRFARDRKAALKALAYQFLNLARRKHIPVVVRLKEFQPGDSHAICAILTQCCDI